MQNIVLYLDFEWWTSWLCRAQLALLLPSALISSFFFSLFHNFHPPLPTVKHLSCSFALGALFPWQSLFPPTPNELLHSYSHPHPTDPFLMLIRQCEAMKTAVLCCGVSPSGSESRTGPLHIHELSGKTPSLCVVCVCICVCLSTPQLNMFWCMILAVTTVYGSIYGSVLVIELLDENISKYKHIINSKSSFVRAEWSLRASEARMSAINPLRGRSNWSVLSEQHSFCCCKFW